MVTPYQWQQMIGAMTCLYADKVLVGDRFSSHQEAGSDDQR
jgi:hypothetical protein